MARSHNGEFPYSDNDLVIGVAAKDATRGMFAVLPAPDLPSTLDAGMATAAMVGIYYDAVRSLQSVATKAAKDGKDVAEAVTTAAAAFKPSEDRSLSTIGNRRVDCAKRMLAEALPKRGVQPTEANINANLGGFLNAKRADVDAALLAELNAGYEVRKKGTGGASAESGTALDW